MSQSDTVPSIAASYDAVVVGSGHNGLVAAAYLARAGKSVLVLERSRHFGGATISAQIFPDYDAQLSKYSYLVSLLPACIIEELGLNFQTRRRTIASFTPWKDAAGRQRGLVLSNVDADRSRESLSEMTGSSTAWDKYQKLLALESAMADIVWPSLTEPLQSRELFQSRLKTELQKEAWRSFVDEPLGNVIERYAEHDALRGLIMTDGKIGVLTHPDDESLLQNRCFLYHIVGNGTGEWRVPLGGMKSLTDALLNCCRSHKVHLQSDSEVLRVEPGPRFHKVTATVGGLTKSIDCRYVLINASPKAYAAMLDEPWIPAASDEGCSVKVNMLLRRLPKLKADVRPDEAFCGSFHIDEGYEQMKRSFQSAAAAQIPDPVPGEMYCHTLTDPSILSPELREQGYHTLTLFGLDMPYRLFEQNHDARRDLILQRYLNGLNQLCDEPFTDCLAMDRSGRPCIEIRTPQDLEREVGLDLGNIFHNTLSWFFADDVTLAGTWGVETKHLGIFRAGSSAHRGGAVSGIPGRNTAMAILSPSGHR
jgi:phytoene dehydrogenase-like protein